MVSITKNEGIKYTSLIPQITLILFVLSSFYFIYVSNVSQKMIRGEIKKSMDDNTINILKIINKKDSISNALKHVDIDEIIKYYDDKETRYFTLENKWLIYSSYFIVLILMVLSYFVYNKNNCVNFNFTNIFINIFITILFILIIEILFFITIIRNYEIININDIKIDLLQTLKDKIKKP